MSQSPHEPLNADVGTVLRIVLTSVLLGLSVIWLVQGKVFAASVILWPIMGLWLSSGRSTREDITSHYQPPNRAAAEKRARDREMLLRFTGKIQPKEWPRQPARPAEEWEP